MKKESCAEMCPATELFTLLSKCHMLLLLYTLTGGPKGFNELQEQLSINTATLAGRLRELEDAMIVERQPCKEDSRSHYYVLTKKGEKISGLIEKLSEVSR